MPQLVPYVSDDESWRVRRGLYEELLAKPDTLLLLASVEDSIVGYGLAHVMPVDDVDPRHLGDGLANRRDRIAERVTAIPWQRIGL
jgi:hypothetical protein